MEGSDQRVRASQLKQRTGQTVMARPDHSNAWLHTGDPPTRAAKPAGRSYLGLAALHDDLRRICQADSIYLSICLNWAYLVGLIIIMVGRPGLDPGTLGLKGRIQIVQEIEPSLLGQLRSGQVSSRRTSRSLCPLI